MKNLPKPSPNIFLDKHYVKFLLILMILFSCRIATAQNTYYVSTSGDDSNSGLSESTPWKTLDKVSTASIQAGDSVLFKRGDEFIGQIKPQYSGTSSSPITFSAYGSGAKPIINGATASGGDHLAAILINNQEYFNISSLEITNERLVSRSGVNDEQAYGIYVLNNGTNVMHHFDFSDLTVREVYAINTSGVSFNSLKVAGIYFRSERNTVAGQEKHIKNVWLTDSYFTLTGKFGFWSQHAGGDTGVGNDSLNRNMNYILADNHFYKTGGSGITPGGTYNCLVENNIFDYPGSNEDSRMAKRGSGAWFFNCRNVIAQYNKSYHARGDNDSYGMHIDFGNKYIILQYNYSEDNQGFVEILGKNLYATYRYNISVNDGRRANKGNTFWISDYAGSGNSVKSDSSYIYNNTVYVDKTPEGDFLKPGLQLTSNDAFITNNAIYVKSGAHIGYKQFNRDASVQVDNNLYFGDVRESNFTDQDASSVSGNPLYLNPGVLNDPDSYKLETGSPAIGGGTSMTEPLFPMAGKGIFASITEKATEDYFGNAVDLSTSGVNIGAYNGSGEISQGNNTPPEGPIFEAEDASLSGGLETNSCAAYSNDLAVKAFSQGSGQELSFDYIDVPEAGSYDLEIHYLTTANRSFTYQVNGGMSITDNITASGSFCYQGGTTAATTITVQLNQGTNNLTFSDAPIIDYVKLVVVSGGDFEAEDATLSGTAVETNCSLASGGKMVKNIDSGASNGVSFSNVGVSETGLYELTIDYYAVNSRNLTYQINGGTAQTIAIGASGQWCYQGGSPGSHTLEVVLNTGFNTIYFYDSPILDKISITAISGGGTFEAEDATLSGTATVNNCSQMSNGQSVKSLGGGSSNAVTFDVNVGITGNYDLTVSYIAATAVSMDIEINGTLQTLSVPSTGQWCYQGGGPGDYTTTVGLNFGANTIKIYNSPQLDKIEVSSTPVNRNALVIKQEGNALENYILVYPNSIGKHQNIHIEIDDQLPNFEYADVSMWDMTGRRIIGPIGKTSRSFGISTRNIERVGVYILKIVVGNQVFTKRLMIH